MDDDLACIFCKIARGEIPSEKLFEDESVFVVRDIAPQAPTHLLVIPKAHVASLSELSDPALAGHLLTLTGEMARREGLAQGWRLIVNTGRHGGQEVPHLHLHVLGGRALGRMLPG